VKTRGVQIFVRLTGPGQFGVVMHIVHCVKILAELCCHRHIFSLLTFSSVPNLIL